MEYEEIKKLINDMGNSQLTELNIEFPNGIKISMNKKNNNENKKEVLAVNNCTKELNNVVEDNINKNNIAIDTNYKCVKSPIVGTFYSKASPDSNVFVQIGQKVKKGDILCIVESMKLMNEIESEFDGEISEICVKDGEMVEYNQTLFKIK